MPFDIVTWTRAVAEGAAIIRRLEQNEQYIGYSAFAVKCGLIEDESKWNQTHIAPVSKLLDIIAALDIDASKSKTLDYLRVQPKNGFKPEKTHINHDWRLVKTGDDAPVEITEKKTTVPLAS